MSKSGSKWQKVVKTGFSEQKAAKTGSQGIKVAREGPKTHPHGYPPRGVPMGTHPGVDVPGDPRAESARDRPKSGPVLPCLTTQPETRGTRPPQAAPPGTTTSLSDRPGRSPLEIGARGTHTLVTHVILRKKSKKLRRAKRTKTTELGCAGSPWTRGVRRSRAR